MVTYTALWRVQIEADSDGEARAKHIDALRAADDAPCTIYVMGDGPKRPYDPSTECGDRGPRIGNSGTLVCVLPKGHDGYHQPDPSWDQPGWAPLRSPR